MAAEKTFVSKSQIGVVRQLHQKKYRKAMGLFIAEGTKLVLELLQSNFKVQTLYVTENVSTLFIPYKHTNIVWCKPADMEKISTLSTPTDVLAVVQAPNYTEDELDYTQWTVLLDDVQDPGNMGTIIRIADWCGVSQIICSTNTAEWLNPKVVQATMGSITRVKVVYTDLQALINKHSQLPVYGAMLQGQNIYEIQSLSSGFLLMGNEGKGVNEVLQQSITTAITIPGNGKAESLNVAVATGILLSYLTAR